MIFDETEKKWVIGKIQRIFGDVYIDVFKADTEWLAVKYDDKSKNVQRFSKIIGPIYDDDIFGDDVETTKVYLILFDYILSIKMNVTKQIYSRLKLNKLRKKSKIMQHQ